MRHLQGVLALVLLGVGWWLVRLAGGTVSAFTHVMYIPIVLSGLAYGVAGGLGAGAAAGTLMALTPVSIASGQPQTLAYVAVRTGTFMLIGGLVGNAVQRRRAQHREMERLLIQSVTALTNAMSATHAETATHSLRVAEVSAWLGQKLNLDEQRLFDLRMGSLLHDIGKLAVPGDVLDKPGRLTSEEYRVVKEHTVAGADILKAFDYSRISAVQDIVRHHHERLDGSGYPDGLRGGEISLLARIVAVADVYDALTNNRSYRARLAHPEAMAILRQEAGAGRLDNRLVNLIDESPWVPTGLESAAAEVASEAV